MKNISLVGFIIFLFSCGSKATEISNTAIDSVRGSAISESELDKTFEELKLIGADRSILENLKYLTIPFHAHDLSENPELLVVMNDLIHVSGAGLKAPGEEMNSETLYWRVGKVKETDDFVMVVLGFKTGEANQTWVEEGAQYLIATFSNEGTAISSVLFSDERNVECCTEVNYSSFVDQDGNIEVHKVSSEYDENTGFHSSASESIKRYKIETSGTFTEIESKNGKLPIAVTYYSIPDFGLIAIENIDSESILFDLQVGLAGNEDGSGSCAGGVKDRALPMGKDGQMFVYESAEVDASCSLTFELRASSVVVNESGETCDHGANCSFTAEYKKQFTSRNEESSVFLLSWPRMTDVKFGCMLEKKFKIADPSFNCDRRPYDATLEPSHETYLEEYVLPTEAVKSIHASIESITVVFEHGDLMTVTLDFSKAMAIPDIQRIFSLPVFNGIYSTPYKNVMNIDYGSDYNAADNTTLQYTKQMIIFGFEHMGGGD